MAQLILDEGAAPSTPSAGKVTIYAKADGKMYGKDDAGLETAFGGGAGDVVGPGVATNNSLVRFDGTTGKLIKDGAVIGVDVQAYDADLTTWAGVTPGTGVATALAVNLGSAGAVASLGTAETFTAPQRGTITTDNDGSFNQSTTNNFFCTPTGAAALTFTNHTAGQSGLILFVNGSNYAITAAATTYIAAADLVKLSATGTYLIAYLDNGTNAYCTVTAALTSAGV